MFVAAGFPIWDYKILIQRIRMSEYEINSHRENHTSIETKGNYNSNNLLRLGLCALCNLSISTNHISTYWTYFNSLFATTVYYIHTLYSISHNRRAENLQRRKRSLLLTNYFPFCIAMFAKPLASVSCPIWTIESQKSFFC